MSEHLQSLTGPAAEGDRVVEIDGRRVALNLRGQGAAMVVLETGLGAESAEWEPVQAQVATFARVMRYDRAGRGASDPAPTPRSAGDMVEELHRVLREAGVTEAVILVGHSYGGLIARLFAHRYPDQTAGLVLVDSMHEDQFEIFGPLMPPPSPGEPAELTGMRAFWNAGWRDPASTTERIDFLASQAQGHAIETLGDLPMRVLEAGTFLNAPFVPGPARPKLQGLWHDLQARLAALSTAAVLAPVPASGHFIQRDDPAAVVAAVRSLVDAPRG